MNTEINKRVEEDLTITLNKDEALVLQNLLNSFQWAVAGDHYFRELYYSLYRFTNIPTLTTPAMIPYSNPLYDVLVKLPGSSE